MGYTHMIINFLYIWIELTDLILFIHFGIQYIGIV